MLVCLVAVSAGACASRTADDDRDGIADALEQSLAERMLPALHVSKLETCPQPLGPKPVLFRARHPVFRNVPDDNYIVINYVVLYDADCGDGPHQGDDEPLVVFARKEAAGKNGADDYVFDSLAATAHTNTAIERRTSSRNRDIWIQPNKHSHFAEFKGCPACDLGGPSWEVALFNVGEPAAPLISDLGRVRGAYRGVDPWSLRERFYGAGIIGAEDLSLRYFTYLTYPAGAPGARWDDD